MKLRIKRLSPDAILPRYAHPGDAGLDLYATHAGLVSPSATTEFSTGIAVEIPRGHVGLVMPRSGLAFKRGIDTMAGVIDAPYRGEIKVLLTTHKFAYHQIQRGDRIAQLLIIPCVEVEIEEADDLADTERGAGGFGSSGR